MKHELAVVFLLDALEHARGSVHVLRTAVDCALERDRRRRFQQFAAAAERDVEVLERLCSALTVSSDHPTTAREIVKDAAESLAKQMVSALAEADRSIAEIIACQCIVLAETRSLGNLEVMAHVAPQLPAPAAAAWSTAAADVTAGVTERLAYAKETWTELLLRRLDVVPRVATAGTSGGEPTEQAANG